MSYSRDELLFRLKNVPHSEYKEKALSLLSIIQTVDPESETYKEYVKNAELNYHIAVKYGKLEADRLTRKAIRKDPPNIVA